MQTRDLGVAKQIFVVEMVVSEISEVRFESVGFKKEFGFQLLRLEDVFYREPSSERHPFKSSRINFFTIILVTEGEMTHEVDFTKYKMTKGDCIFISKGQIHKFDPSPVYKGYGLVFTEAYMLHYISPSALSKISFLYNNHLSPLNFNDDGDLDDLIRTMKKEFSYELGSIKADVVASMLTVFLLKAQLRTGDVLRTNRRDHQQFTRFQNLVASKYMETRKARQYAALLNMTYKQLNEVCKVITRKTAKEYIDAYVALEAKRRLALTELSVKLIAFECGFSEATNFLKFFKKEADITPKQFRATKT